MADLPKGINTRQLLEYAKNNGYKSVKFLGRNEKASFVGQFLDAYFEFVKIPALGDGFVTIGQIENEIGYDIIFDVLDDEDYQRLVKLDFILRGKTPPSEERED